MENVIKTEKITYSYECGSDFSKKILDEITLEINKGEFIGIIGHTGSGKSTLIQHFNGLIKPTSGKVLFYGNDINEKGFSKKKLREQVSLVFQYPENQLFEETVLKDVMFGPKNQGLSEEEQKNIAIKVLTDVGITEKMFEMSPFELSGGQKRRVAIAGCLAMRPEVLVLDEPTAGLDPRGRKQILNLIKSLQKNLGITVVLISHSMEDIARLADRLLVINDGKLEYDDKPEEVFKHMTELENMGLKAPETAYLSKELGFENILLQPEEVIQEIIKMAK